MEQEERGKAWVLRSMGFEENSLSTLVATAKRPAWGPGRAAAALERALFWVCSAKYTCELG
jgi:hypothetical protein